MLHQQEQINGLICHQGVSLITFPEAQCGVALRLCSRATRRALQCTARRPLAQEKQWMTGPNSMLKTWILLAILLEKKI